MEQNPSILCIFRHSAHLAPIRKPIPIREKLKVSLGVGAYVVRSREGSDLGDRASSMIELDEPASREWTDFLSRVPWQLYSIKQI